MILTVKGGSGPKSEILRTSLEHGLEVDGDDGGNLKTMRVTFFMGEKKFGPAEEQTKGNREIEKITGKKKVQGDT